MTLVKAKFNAAGAVGRGRIAYHRFVKTTPKPRATKKRSGELVLLLLLLPLPGMLVDEGVVVIEDVGEGEKVVAELASVVVLFILGGERAKRPTLVASEVLLTTQYNHQRFSRPFPIN